MLCHEGGAAYDEHTLVNQAVEAAKKTKAVQAQAAFINACLRRFLRERSTLLAQTDADVLAQWNHPPWWVKQLKIDWPAQWGNYFDRRSISRSRGVACERQKDHAAGLFGTAAASWHRRCSCGRTWFAPGEVLRGCSCCSQFAQGWVSVQDGAAQMAAPLLLSGLSSQQGAHACSTPVLRRVAKRPTCWNSQTLTSWRWTSMPAAASVSTRTCSVWAFRAQVKAADAGELNTRWDGALFDAVLLDAPCSASGIVRRHPDIRWLRRPGDIAQLVDIQRSLLNRLWPVLKPGGVMLYCTCSVFSAEGEAQAQTFLANNIDALLLPSPGHLLPGLVGGCVEVVDNAQCDHDGFFYALLRKAER